MPEEFSVAPPLASAGGWILLGDSVRGTSHQRSGAPNQDALRLIKSDGEAPTIIAVADGHGSEKCFRSDVGSRIAVDVATEVLGGFLTRMGDCEPAIVEAAARRLLPHDLVEGWRREVSNHFERNPLEDARPAEAQDAAASAVRNTSPTAVQIPYVAYGATLIAVALHRNYCLLLQLGDGDILFVGTDARVSSPLPDDPELIANETTSLSMRHAAELFRIGFVLLDEGAPGLILVSTDGYSNSYITPDDFLKVGSDYMLLLQKSGAAAVSEQLPIWLAGISQEGSGDDISIGLAFRARDMAAPADASFKSAPTHHG